MSVLPPRVDEYWRLEQAVSIAKQVQRSVTGSAQEAARQFAFELVPGSRALRRVALLTARRIGLDPIAVARVWAHLAEYLEQGVAP